jgi:3-dehydroquinate dehydratase
MKPLMFVRLKNRDDIVGYITETENSVKIDKPLIVDIETFFDEGRQIIAMREYIPQTIVHMTSVTFKKSEIQFMYKVREEFANEYVELATMFYEEIPKLKTTKKKEKSTGELADKVISLMDALSDKKDKPVH